MRGRRIAPSARGFTLIELMMTLVILAIIAAVALPQYTTYVKRSKLIEATTNLSDLRSRMEKYFMDNRTYLDLGAGNCEVIANGALAALNIPSNSFTYSCPASAATTYTLRATANAGSPVAGAIYSINQLNTKVTVAPVTGWTAPGSNCWAIRPDGSCS